MIGLEREPDVIDTVILGTMTQFRHEHRMAEIRELDLKQWVAEVGNS